MTSPRPSAVCQPPARPAAAGHAPWFRSPRVAVAALFVLGALVGAACGPTTAATRPAPAPAPVVTPALSPAVGALVVRNGTVDPLTLRVDGAPVAELVPGGTWRDDALPAGRHDVVAANAAIGVTHARGVEVLSGREVRWLVRQRFGALVVTNETRRPVTVEIAGEAVGTVAPGGEAHFRAVPEGRRDVRARTPRGGVVADATLTFEEGEARAWRVRARAPAPPPPARLEVYNTTDVPLTVYRDGFPLGDVAAGASGRFDGLTPGEARLAARNRRGDVLASAVLALRPGAAASWRVALASCRLRVENRSTTRYLVTIDGRHVGPVGPKRAHVYAGVRPGTRRIEARPVEGGVLRTREIVCPAGGSVEWVVTPPPRAALDVHNGTAAPLAVSMNGRRLGTVRPGLTTRYRNLAPGVHRFEATAAGAPPHASELELRPGEVAGWSIGPRPATLAVRNGWDAPAIIVMDGRRIGRIPPRGAKRFEALVAGRHVVRAERAGGPPQVATLVLREGRTSEWAITPDAPATLRVVNRNAVPVTLFLSGRDQGRLAPGAERVFPDIRPGSLDVEARAPNGARDADRLALAPGAVVVWMARLPDHASLTVVNHARTDVAVSLGGRGLGVVRSGAKRTFPGLPPGRHEVRATRPGGAPLVAEQRLSLTTGAETAWVVRDLPGARLRVRNHGRERIVVFLAEHRLGPVPAGGEVVFPDLQGGRLPVVARALDGRVLARDRVVLRPGGPATSWTVKPAPTTGAVVIENHVGVAIRVLEGRTVVAEVPAGGRVVVDLPRGRHELRAYDTAPRPALVATKDVRVGPRPATWRVRKPRKRLPVPTKVRKPSREVPPRGAR